MNSERFKPQYETMLKNIDELRAAVNKPPEMTSPQGKKAMDKVTYLFSGLVLTLIDVGNSIVHENNFRRPLNKADVFISLAEHKVLLASVIAGVKKAVFAIPKINHCSSSELLAIIAETIDALAKTLDCFAAHFNLQKAEQEK